MVAFGGFVLFIVGIDGGIPGRIKPWQFLKCLPLPQEHFFCLPGLNARLFDTSAFRSQFYYHFIVLRFLFAYDSDHVWQLRQLQTAPSSVLPTVQAV